MNNLSTINRKKFFQERVPIYKEDPRLFCREVLLFEPDDWQEQALLDLAQNPKVTIRSGQGVGKTGMEACALLWFLSCFPFPRVVATAPTRQQLHDVLWSEVAKWMANSPLLKKILKWTKTRIYMVKHEERWYATARTATKAENMQGFHEENMLFIVDEASGVTDPIMEAILGTLSGKNNKLLMCGNPTKRSGVFYDSHTKDRALYKVHKISSRDSIRTNKKNIEALERKYGKNSNVVRVRVDGEFPTEEDDIFIPLSLVERAAMTEPEEDEVESIDLGVDVARFGDDETVIAPKVNEEILPLIIRHGQDLMRTVGDVLKACNKLRDKCQYAGRVTVKIDDTGLGGGVTDRLREIKREQQLEWLVIIPVNFAQSIKHKYYADITTFAWGIVRDLLGFRDDDDGTEDEASCDLILPNDTELIAQFSVRKYSLASNGKVKIESKKEMKKRGIKSPDRADAVALACLPVKFNSNNERKKGGRAGGI